MYKRVGKNAIFVTGLAHAISISVQVGAAVVGHLRQDEAGMTVSSMGI